MKPIREQIEEFDSEKEVLQRESEIELGKLIEKMSGKHLDERFYILSKYCGIDVNKHCPYMILISLLRKLPLVSAGLNIMNYGDAGTGKSQSYDREEANQYVYICDDKPSVAQLRGNAKNDTKPLLEYSVMVIEEATTGDLEFKEVMKQIKTSNHYKIRDSGEDRETEVSIVENSNVETEELFKNGRINYQVLKMTESMLSREHLLLPHSKEYLGDFIYEESPNDLIFNIALIGLRHKGKISLNTGRRETDNQLKVLFAICKLFFPERANEENLLETLDTKLLDAFTSLISFFSYNQKTGISFLNEETAWLFAVIYGIEAEEILFLQEHLFGVQTSNFVYIVAADGIGQKHIKSLWEEIQEKPSAFLPRAKASEHFTYIKYPLKEDWEFLPALVEKQKRSCSRSDREAFREKEGQLHSKRYSSAISNIQIFVSSFCKDIYHENSSDSYQLYLPHELYRIISMDCILSNGTYQSLKENISRGIYSPNYSINMPTVPISLKKVLALVLYSLSQNLLNNWKSLKLHPKILFALYKDKVSSFFNTEWNFPTFSLELQSFIKQLEDRIDAEYLLFESAKEEIFQRNPLLFPDILTELLGEEKYCFITADLIPLRII